MLKSYQAIHGEFRQEIIVKKSRFITSFKEVSTEEEAQSFIAQIKKEFWDATHNCSCYRIGIDRYYERSADDGEPAGTAGRPMLEVLRKADITNTVVVVTRYFGGIKLGAGGLIRAYAGAVAEALVVARLVVYTPHIICRLNFAYELLGLLEREQNERDWLISARIFTEEVELKMEIPTKQWEEFVQVIKDLMAGKVKIEKGLEIYIPSPLKQK